MIVLAVLAWLTSFACLACYGVMAFRGRVKPYHWSNVLGGLYLTAFNALTIGTAAGPAIVVEFFYAVVASAALVRIYKEKA